MFRMRVLAFFPLTLFTFLACSGGGGSSSGNGSLAVVGSSVLSGQVLPINVPVEITFNKPILDSTLNALSFNFTPLPSSTVGAPVAGPVIGSYFLKPGSSGLTVVFQPSCPTNADNSNGGFLPGNIFGSVEYQLIIPAFSSTQPQVVTAEDGSTLGTTFTLTFQTPSPPASPLLDLVGGPPSVVDTEELPDTLGLNLSIHPVDAISITINQAVLSGSVDNDSVKLTFDNSGTTTRIPATVTLSENCNSTSRAILTVVPLGVLPAGETITFTLSKDLKGFGVGDQNFADVAFHTSIVDGVGGNPQKDVILEEFDDSDDLDDDAPIFTPFALWESGKLQSPPIFPGSASTNDFEIGPNTTNTDNEVFDTQNGSLKNTNGTTINFTGGVIECRNFTLKAGTSTNKTLFTGKGSNPLIIRCLETFTIENNAELIVSGQQGGTVTGLCTANIQSNNGGVGSAGGGDGGEGSPTFTASSTRGGDGKGPFNTIGGGGLGGVTGYGFGGTCGQGTGAANFQQARGGGGGGGSFANKTFLSDNTFGRVCYSAAASICDTKSSGQYPAGLCLYPYTNCPAVPCSNPTTFVPNATLGEQGANGAPNSKSVLTNATPAPGGTAGITVFADSNDENDFFGRKPDGLTGIQIGELGTVLGGQGGGAGGDGIGSVTFPPANFLTTDMTAGGGGGGGGVLWVQALEELTVLGAIRANGGNGGDGEEIWNPPSGNGAGGGGGGSGGMIILESPTQVKIGLNAIIEAHGGDRGRGSGTSTTPGGAENFCRKHNTISRGGAGGDGVIAIGTRFSTSTVSCSPVSTTQAAIESGALVVETVSGGATTDITCERDSALISKFAPDPHCLVLSFGPKSGARSPWYYTGQASFVGTPTYLYAGIDTSSGSNSGLVTSSFEESFATGSGGSVISSGSVTVTSSLLADSIRSEPKILIGDSFRAVSGGTALPITNASVSGNTVSLTLDTTNGSVDLIGSWEVLRNYFVPLVDGAVSSFPSSNTTARIQFQGADETTAGSNTVDSGTITSLTSDISTLAGKKFIRFLVNFDMNANSGTLSTSLPRPGFERIRVPYSF